MKTYGFGVVKNNEFICWVQTTATSESRAEGKIMDVYGDVELYNPGSPRHCILFNDVIIPVDGAASVWLD